MHEMGIAAEVLRIARERAEAAGAVRIVGLRLRVGRWSGVERESLRFALEVLGEGTPSEGARLELEEVGPTFSCGSCDETYAGETYFTPCPRCGKEGGRLVAGDELTLAHIEVDGE